MLLICFNLLKEELKKKVPPILAAGATMPPAFKPYPKIKPHIPSLIEGNKKYFKNKSLLDISAINTLEHQDPLKQYYKKHTMFQEASKSDKKMNDIFPGLERFKKEEKSANIIKSFIKNNRERKKQVKEFKEENKIIKTLANTFDVSQFKTEKMNNERKEKVRKRDLLKEVFKQATKSDKNMNDILQGIKFQIL